MQRIDRTAIRKFFVRGWIRRGPEGPRVFEDGGRPREKLTSRMEKSKIKWNEQKRKAGRKKWVERSGKWAIREIPDWTLARDLSVWSPGIFPSPASICLSLSPESFEMQRREVKEAYEKVARLVRLPVHPPFRFNTSATILREECFQRLRNPRIQCLRCLWKSQGNGKQDGGK